MVRIRKSCSPLALLRGFYRKEIRFKIIYFCFFFLFLKFVSNAVLNSFLKHQVYLIEVKVIYNLVISFTDPKMKVSVKCYFYKIVSLERFFQVTNEKKKRNEYIHEWILNKKALTKEPVWVFPNIFFGGLLLYSIHWTTQFVSLRHPSNESANKFGFLCQVNF